MAIEALFQLCEADRREIAVSVRLEIRIVVTRHNVADFVDADENLLAALFDRDALRLLHLRMHGNMLANTGDSLGQPFGLNRLHQVVDGFHLECVQREFAVRRHEHDRWRVLQMLHGLCQLQTGRLRHVDVKEHHVAGIFLQFLYGLAHVGGFARHLYLAQFVKQVLQLRTRRSFVVDDHCLQQFDLQKSVLV